MSNFSALLLPPASITICASRYKGKIPCIIIWRSCLLSFVKPATVSHWTAHHAKNTYEQGIYIISNYLDGRVFSDSSLNKAPYHCAPWIKKGINIFLSTLTLLTVSLNGCVFRLHVFFCKIREACAPFIKALFLFSSLTGWTSTVLFFRKEVSHSPSKLPHYLSNYTNATCFFNLWHP